MLHLALLLAAGAGPQVTFRPPSLVGESNDTFFWIPNTQGGILRVADRGMIITADIDGDGIPPTNCSAVRCPHTVFFSEFEGAPAGRSTPSYGPWKELDTEVPHHRLLIDFGNGTHRGFDSEISFVSTTDHSRAQVRYTDWRYDAANRIVVLGRGVGVFDLPPDVKLQLTHKTTNTMMRLQVGDARLDDGTRLVVTEGTREAPGLAPPCSTIILSTTDDGLSWKFVRIFDRQEGMPVSVHKGTAYPIGPSEGNIALLPDGKTLVLVARMANGKHLWQATSADRGQSWTRMRETQAWAVYPQLLTLGNGVVLLASGRPGIALWALDQATLAWRDFHNLAAAHNSLLPASSPKEWFFPASYAAIASANATVDFHNPLSKAYLGMYELGCDGRSCRVIIMYDALGNGDGVPPGPAGDYDKVFTMEAVVTPA